MIIIRRLCHNYLDNHHDQMVNYDHHSGMRALWLSQTVWHQSLLPSSSLASWASRSLWSLIMIKIDECDELECKIAFMIAMLTLMEIVTIYITIRSIMIISWPSSSVSWSWPWLFNITGPSLCRPLPAWECPSHKLLHSDWGRMGEIVKYENENGMSIRMKMDGWDCQLWEWECGPMGEIAKGLWSWFMTIL